MKASPELLLHEQVLLFALHDEKGTLHSAQVGFALGGAILAELLLRERIRIEEVKRSKLVEVTDPTPCGEPLLDECLERMHTAKRRGAISSWVARIAHIKNLRHRVAERLCRKGILRREEGRTLLVFSRVLYPTVDPSPEERLVEAVRKAVEGEGAVSPRLAILIALTYRTRILHHVLDRDLLKRRKSRLEALQDVDEASKAAGAAVQAAQAAATQAALMAATTTVIVVR